MLRTSVMMILTIGSASVALAQRAPVGFYPMGPSLGSARNSCSAVSADGSVVVGFAQDVALGPETGFRWSYSTGRVQQPLSPGTQQNEFSGVSADGSVSVGHAGQTGVGWSATRQVGAGSAPQNLGQFGGYLSVFAEGVSGDGRVVVGRGYNVIRTSEYGQPFRWTAETGFQGLGAVPGYGDWSLAHATNFDGSVIVGYCANYGAGLGQAFRWTPSGGYSLVQGAAELFAVSPDGQWSAGRSYMNNAVVADASGQVHNLDPLARFAASGAYGITADGSMVVGWGEQDGLGRATIWTQTTGMINLDSYIASLGIAMPTGFYLTAANAVSADGSTIVGSGFHDGRYEGFVVVVPSAPTGLLLLTGLLTAGGVRRRR